MQFSASQSDVASGLLAMLKDPKATAKQLETIQAATKEHDEALAKSQEAMKALMQREEEFKSEKEKLVGISAGLDARSEAIARREDEAVANMRGAVALKDEFESKVLSINSEREDVIRRLNAIEVKEKELLDAVAELDRRNERLRIKEIELADKESKLERKLAAFDAAVNA